MPETSSRKKVDRWVLARKITQGCALAVFFLTVLFSRPDGLTGSQANFLVRLSPLTMLANLLASRSFLAGSTLSLILLFSSLLFGRAWCGWLCPLDTLLDIFRFSRKGERSRIPDGWRTVKYGVLMVILLSAIFGNLTLLFLDPLTLFTRSTALTLLPVVDKLIFVLEKALIKLPFLSDAVFSFDAWLRPGIFSVATASIQYSLLLGLFLIAILLLNLIAERFWCRYLCPLGALLGLPARIAPFQRRKQSGCTECGLCSWDCPTGTIDPHKNFQSDPSECTLCMNCRSSCTQNAFSFILKWQPAPAQVYDANRRTVLAAIGISITATALMSVDWLKHKASNFLLRPPGVTDEKSFLSKCIRCGVCLKVCPTQALQADISQSGLEGLMTPILLPRNGFCDFSCNACGQSCPVQAIPPLSIEEKHLATLGHAYIDHNRCIAWADHENCIVCEEMCPLPQKAITLETTSFVAPDGSTVAVKLPVVDRSRCIGCGTCENKCPLPGDAAIRVYTLSN